MSEAHRPSIFLSTPSARRATSPPGSVCQAYRYFYPRPPRGGRPHRWRRYSWQWRISIHALREEGDQLSGPVMLLPYQFLSTPSARRATEPERRGQVPPEISIHALREEGDKPGLSKETDINIFLSTPSARRATQDTTEMPENLMISIHALREEGDGARHGWRASGHDYFYPRPPRGGRPPST